MSTLSPANLMPIEKLDHTQVLASFVKYSRMCGHLKSVERKFIQFMDYSHRVCGIR